MKFTDFLGSLLNTERYRHLAVSLRQKPKDLIYANGPWHSIDELLAEYPKERKLLNEYACYNKDEEFGGFSPANLKACYIVDEDFINNGRAFILFNLVGSNWTHVGHLNDQAKFWKLEK
jgi:hypothetical protein